jgi:hypothetical protein
MNADSQAYRFCRRTRRLCRSHYPAPPNRRAGLAGCALRREWQRKRSRYSRYSAKRAILAAEGQRIDYERPRTPFAGCDAV